MARQSLLLIAVLLAACRAQKPDAANREEATSTAAVLLEIDGVRVYRFFDAGHYHYFAVPRNGAFANAMTDWSETHCNPCGKSTCCYTVTLNEEVPTAQR